MVNDYLHILSNPAHLAAELTFMLLFDVLFLGLVWPLIRNAIKREHKRIDSEHGISHDDV